MEQRICKCCGKLFEPSKNDKRIAFCSKECRLENRKKMGYGKKYYQEHKDRWQEKLKTEKYREKRKIYNEKRREKYKNNENFRNEIKEKVRDYYKQNPEVKMAQRLKPFGITLDEYHEMQKRQSGKCAICGAEIGDVKGNRLYIDHNHKTGKVRGLLCSSCNLGIGKFYDRIDLLQNAIKYLEEANGADIDMVRT